MGADTAAARFVEHFTDPLYGDESNDHAPFGERRRLGHAARRIPRAAELTGSSTIPDLLATASDDPDGLLEEPQEGGPEFDQYPHRRRVRNVWWLRRRGTRASHPDQRVHPRGTAGPPPGQDPKNRDKHQGLARHGSQLQRPRRNTRQVDQRTGQHRATIAVASGRTRQGRQRAVSRFPPAPTGRLGAPRSLPLLQAQRIH